MKRHSFALTILLASLATPLLSVGSARCQSGVPNYRNQCEVCPLLEDYCSDFDFYYGSAEIASARYDDELLDPRFDPETGRYVGHDEVKPIETVATPGELDEFYASCEDTCNAEVQDAYAAEVKAETKLEAADEARYNEEYYDDYDYDYESYDYDYQAEDYWYEESVEVADEATEETAEEVYQDSYDYDYGYDEYDNYDYEYETYDYQAYDYEAEIAAEYAAAEQDAASDPLAVEPHPPVVAEEVLAAEEQAVEEAVAAEAWDYQAEGYDPYAYDYEAYEYDYEVYENGAVATPVEETADSQDLTSEHEADFAETWTDSPKEEESAEEEYTYEYDYDYDYGVDYESQPEVAEVEAESVDTLSPLASAVSRQALLGAANLLDSLSQVLKNASTGLERTAALDSNLR